MSERPNINDLLTPAQVSSELYSAGLTEDQADTIAAEVYQPLYEMIRHMALHSIPAASKPPMELWQLD